jgi:hypothetical protein
MKAGSLFALGVGATAVGIVTVAVALFVPENVSAVGLARCVVHGHHEPRRHPLGGFRCETCGLSGRDLDDFGFVDGGWVSPVRRVFTRHGAGGHAESTRTSGYESGRA